MANSRPKIVLCICTYDRYDLLPKAIESATKQTLPVDQFDILVIDNSPDHNRAEAFGKRFASIENLTYFIERTPGLANARNVAVAMTRAPLIAYMDDDAVASPAWLQEILNAFKIFGGTAMIVGGRVDPIWSAPRPSWVHESMLGNLSVINWGGEARVAAPKEWVAGTNIAFRTSAVLENGGFARNLGRIGSGSSLLSNEEIQLVEKICASGGVTIYAPEAKVDHLVDASRLTRTWFRKRSAWQAVSDFIMAPDRSSAEAKHRWQSILDYFNALPPQERTVRGLMLETDDPDLFLWQTSAIYTLTTLQLAGFEGVELV